MKDSLGDKKWCSKGSSYPYYCIYVEGHTGPCRFYDEEKDMIMIDGRSKKPFVERIEKEKDEK